MEQVMAVEQQKREAERKAKVEEDRRQREAELAKHRPFIHSQHVLEQRFYSNAPTTVPALTMATVGADVGTDYDGCHGAANTLVSRLFNHSAGYVHAIFLQGSGCGGDGGGGGGGGELNFNQPLWTCLKFYGR
jgi:hypothetical protein